MKYQITQISDSKEFQTDVYEYNVDVTSDINKLELQTVATEANANVEITGNDPIQINFEGYGDLLTTETNTVENTMKIDTIDERLTTVEAHKTMNFLDINKNKKRNIVDTISAVYILETYLNKIKNQLSKQKKQCIIFKIKLNLKGVKNGRRRIR